MATNQLSDQQLADILNGLYDTYTARAPDAGGYQWWQDNAQRYLDQGGTQALTNAFAGAALSNPGDAGYAQVRAMAPGANNLTRDEASQWADYMAKASAEQQGMNNMPHVFSNYAALANATPEQANAMIYNTPEQQADLIKATNDYWGLTGGFGGLGGSGKGKTGNGASNDPYAIPEGALWNDRVFYPGEVNYLTVGARRG